MNTEAERKKSFGAYIPEDFQRRYASVIIDLEHLNRDLQDYLTNVQNYCQEVSSDKYFYLCMMCTFFTKYIISYFQNLMHMTDQPLCRM